MFDVQELCTFLFLVYCRCVAAHASAAFLLEEPYGHFGAMNPDWARSRVSEWCLCGFSHPSTPLPYW